MCVLLRPSIPLISRHRRGILFRGVSTLDKPKYRNTVEDLRLSPELRLCPKFDAVSIANFRVASLEKMGVRVADNCAEEHIM